MQILEQRSSDLRWGASCTLTPKTQQGSLVTPEPQKISTLLCHMVIMGSSQTLNLNQHKDQAFSFSVREGNQKDTRQDSEHSI